MSKITIDVDVKNLDAFRNLVSLLEAHFEDLPEQLQNSLKDISDNGSVNSEIEYIKKLQLKDSNTLVVKVKMQLPDEALKRMSDHVQKITGHKRIMILEDCDLEILE